MDCSPGGDAGRRSTRLWLRPRDPRAALRAIADRRIRRRLRPASRPRAGVRLLRRGRRPLGSEPEDGSADRRRHDVRRAGDRLLRRLCRLFLPLPRRRGAKIGRSAYCNAAGSLPALAVPMSTPLAAPDQDLVQETLLGEALEHAPVGAIVLDEHGRYLAANRLACQLSGYSREEFLEEGAESLAFDTRSLALMANGDLKGGIAEMRRKEGSAVTCEYRVGATRSGGLPFHVVVFWEIEAAP